MRGHCYTEEQDEFIRNNYKNIAKCMALFNQKYGTTLSYGAIKAHALRTLKITTGFRSWTPIHSARITELLSDNSYKIATELFNKEFGTSFTQKNIQDYCTKRHIKRNVVMKRKVIDEIILRNHKDKSYEEIRHIIFQKTGVRYCDSSAVCARALQMGLSRPHRVWDCKKDHRYVDGEEVSYSEFMRFIGNRWHRLPDKQLRTVALQVVRLQALSKTD